MGNEKLKFRSNLAQWLATIAAGMVFLAVGMMVAILSVVNGALHNSNSEFVLNDSQASWFGSLMLIVQPLGCIISGFLQKYIGRKYGMILMNIPQLTSWILMYKATSVEALYIASISMGISAGFMEAPGITYIGEATRPKIRGILTSYLNMNVSIGMLVVFFVGSIVDWRTTVAICTIIPVISIIIIAMIPDSPIWLLTKGRKKEALQALCWLRGWVSKEKVKTEFEQLCCYTEASKNSKTKADLDHIFVQAETEVNNVEDLGADDEPSTFANSSSWKSKMNNLFRPELMKPVRLILGYQFFFNCAALNGLRPYMIETYRVFNMPVKPESLAFGLMSISLLGAITCVATVKSIGKRRLSLISMTLCSLSCILLGFYALFKDQFPAPWIPLILFCFLAFSMNVGIGPIPWMLLTEVYPVSWRSTGAGFSAATFYLIAFIFSMTYLDLEHLVQLHGCFFLYGIAGLVGILFLYIYLPETEGKTLAQIEDHFSKIRRQRIDLST